MATFKKAVKAESKLRLALAGPAGSGKTYTALTLALALADGKPVAVLDTERGSASKYADLFEFDVLELEDFSPARYVEGIRAAVAEGYGVVVVDSLSHAWNGRGGLLEAVERIAKMRHNGNTFKAWGDNEIRALETGLVEALTGSPVHIIATMRSKAEYVVEQNDRGKATPRKVGTAPIQRDGFEYEFDVFGEMTQDNELIVQKTRCPALAGALISKPGVGLANTLKDWLHGATIVEETVQERRPQPLPVKKPAPAPAAQKPVASLADDMARLHTRALATGKVTTQEDWERELREAMHLGYNGDERTITREDFPRLVEHFKNLPGRASSGEDAQDFDLRGEPFRVPA